MFNKFKEKSIKVIRVDNCTFELIVDHDVRVIESERDESMDLAEDEKFIIVSDDTSIICNVVCTHNSINDASTSFIVFEVQ